MTRAQLEQALATNRARAAEIKRETRPIKPTWLRINVRDLREQLEEAREEVSRITAELDLAEEELAEFKSECRKLTPDEKAEMAHLRDERRRLRLALDGRGVVILEDADAPASGAARV